MLYFKSILYYTFKVYYTLKEYTNRRAFNRSLTDLFDISLYSLCLMLNMHTYLPCVCSSYHVVLYMNRYSCLMLEILYRL